MSYLSSVKKKTREYYCRRIMKGSYSLIPYFPTENPSGVLVCGLCYVEPEHVCGTATRLYSLRPASAAVPHFVVGP